MELGRGGGVNPEWGLLELQPTPTSLMGFNHNDKTKCTYIYIYTSHVLCKHSNGKRASLVNYKIDYRLFVGMLLVLQKLS